MDPRHSSEPFSSSKVPAPAWTKTINGAPYTVKRIAADTFAIWREAEELGTFELRGDSPDHLQATYTSDLTLEARVVIDEFIASYAGPFEGAARRDG
jgi:hypothetical protein